MKKENKKSVITSTWKICHPHAWYPCHPNTAWNLCHNLAWPEYLVMWVVQLSWSPFQARGWQKNEVRGWQKREVKIWQKYILLNSRKAFTLVELIIVITILAILATIAYISFQWYTKDARDWVRISDVRQIYNWLSIYKVQTEKTLLPDNYINIQSWTTTISYQWYAWANVLRGLRISWWQDPATKDYYIYTTDVNTKKAQLMTYMETSDKDIQYLSLNNIKNKQNNINQLKEELTNIKLLRQAEATTNSWYYQDKKIYVYWDN